MLAVLHTAVLKKTL